jgi:hypothetical protein
MTMMRVLLRKMTTLDVDAVIQRMSPGDLRFVHRLLVTCQSGTGFMNALEHRVDDLAGITAPVLVMYSLYDKSVPPRNAKHVAAEVVGANSMKYPPIRI